MSKTKLGLACVTLLAVVVLGGWAWKAMADKQAAAPLQVLAEKLVPLHEKLAPPKSGEWLDQHQEPGQTLEQYIACKPNTPSSPRNIIYVQPLGEFTPTQRKVVELSAEFMSRYFDRPVKIREDLPLSLIPDSAKRIHPTWGMNQIHTGEIRDNLLRKRLPDDAAAYIAFTASDLWPGAGWNFVFGEASLRDRVGVWSIYRFGDPEASPEAFQLCLRRTMGTAVHETGHMFSMNHCTAYECVMCGSNSLSESDRRPIYACPECAAKIWYATGADPRKQFLRLAEFCRTSDLVGEQAYYERAAKVLEK